MRVARMWFALLAVMALVLPGVASAQRVVPPGNSAVNQYTEAYPTAGGNAVNEGGPPSSARALGARNADRLEALGPDGRAAAALAAVTAPSRVTAGRDGGQGIGSGSESGKQANAPGGSSGLVEVLGQVTGSSANGEMGLLLPLVIVGAFLLSLASLLRRRRRGSA